ncbi:DinB family protein [Rugosimonospora africana]
MASRFADMFVDLNDDPRVDAPGQADERSTLLGFLRWQRATLELKCAGLTPADLARRSLEPSKLSLLGLVRHLTDVERGWFRGGLAQEDTASLYSSREDPDGDFDGAVPDPEVVAAAWAAWREEAEYTDRFVRSADFGLSVPDEWRGPLSLRWVLIHCVEEYARHLGHADVLRERIDGRVGQ